MQKAHEALERLIEGNRRFVAGLQNQDSQSRQAGSYRLVAEQKPFAIVIGCSDSRVPAEIVFDQGLGDLFVIRVAGNVVTPPQIGSVEFAATQFGAQLVLVLGHSRCGAVEATLRELEQPGQPPSPNLGAIVDCIRPAVEPLREASPGADTRQLLAQAVRANIRAAVEQLGRESAILQGLIDRGEIQIVGAEYDLDTGKVDFFEQTD